MKLNYLINKKQIFIDLIIFNLIIVKYYINKIIKVN